jgi:transposase-like protein
MKAGPDRRYTPEFRDSAVKQVLFSAGRCTHLRVISRSRED